jgi:hypothetical protein
VTPAASAARTITRPRGSSSGTAIASTRAAADGQRFSAPMPVRTTSIPEMGLRGALCCLRTTGFSSRAPEPVAYMSDSQDLPGS